jgi:hypothetical protein
MKRKTARKDQKKGDSEVEGTPASVTAVAPVGSSVEAKSAGRIEGQA